VSCLKAFTAFWTAKRATQLKARGGSPVNLDERKSNGFGASFRRDTWVG
jgi:hypothetical protein